ncbi:MAG: hypothetical protein BWZ10_00043 [candidate division BRC1 bacterium ADurb.BinA364]|nr:MAG: hypothetical protein BWZ10_00043 [candidate division BRC1 bacterium ADurb.BinA364]
MRLRVTSRAILTTTIRPCAAWLTSSMSAWSGSYGRTSSAPSSIMAIGRAVLPIQRTAPRRIVSEQAISE